ncbi:MAG: serine hydrolase domain-containing protein [Bryobacteraceae bacterium]|nr:serine hydrolase domain-containing protein [Bryobacteraceae bacterium]
MRRLVFSGLVCLSLAALTAPASELLNGFDLFMEQAMRDHGVNGAAVAVVHEGKLVLMKGYGFRDVAQHLPVTPTTVFPIASITKSFTVTALGALVDEGKLEWDKPVREYLPGFRMYDPVATDQLSPRDLVTHRSGLPRHDIIWYSSSFTREQLVDRLRYLEPNKPLRSTFQYNNLMFVTAGYLGGKVAGSTWEELVRKKILQPLGMTRTMLTSAEARKGNDYALPYRRNLHTDDVSVIEFPNWGDVGPAGSINSNIEDMAKYLLMHVNKGTFEGRTLLSKNNAEQMQTPQMVLRGISPDSELGDQSYGMGFFIQSYRGYKIVSHGGNLDGFSLNLAMMPETRTGVVVLTNLDGASVRDFVPWNIFNRALGLEPIDWSSRFLERRKKAKEQELAAESKGYTGQKKDTRSKS